MGKGFPVVMSDEFQLFCYGLDFLDCSCAARCGVEVRAVVVCLWANHRIAGRLHGSCLKMDGRKLAAEV